MQVFDREKLATELKKKIEDDGREKYVIGAEIGLSPFILNNTKNGKIPQNIGIDTVLKVTNWLDMPVQQFFKEVK